MWGQETQNLSTPALRQYNLILNSQIKLCYTTYNYIFIICIPQNTKYYTNQVLCIIG